MVPGLEHEVIVRVECGHEHTLALTDGGVLYMWGLMHVQGPQVKTQYFGLTDLNEGQRRDMIEKSYYEYLSNGGVSDDIHQSMETVAGFRRHVVTQPRQVVIPNCPHKVVAMAAGYCFTLIVVSNGDVYAFGFNDKGQLGNGTRFMTEVPTLVPELSHECVVSVAAGTQHSVAVTRDGSLFTWGGGIFGLGHPVPKDLLTPKRVMALWPDIGRRVLSVSCGAYHTVCLVEGGAVYNIWPRRGIMLAQKKKGCSLQPLFRPAYLCYCNMRHRDKNFAQTAWNFINDSLRSTVCLQYHPRVVACAVILLAAKMRGFQLPDMVDGKQWFKAFVDESVTREELEAVGDQIKSLYAEEATDPKLKQLLKRAPPDNSRAPSPHHRPQDRPGQKSPLAGGPPGHRPDTPGGQKRRAEGEQHPHAKAQRAA